ncbi:hypothetical protein EDB92DRAFT_1875784 [Lactarius akahatsu]|uniref:Secreted protein n=1 Tax=Lactarius akahatsu TaxID=416441 RepID=A0AAD4LHA1_9AGAM|nr:hypothetical protein EDB92DRAFT_1875784 [Lactarius akahatsu]
MLIKTLVLLLVSHLSPAIRICSKSIHWPTYNTSNCFDFQLLVLSTPDTAISATTVTCSGIPGSLSPQRPPASATQLPHSPNPLVLYVHIFGTPYP